MPITPPLLLISSIASISASTTDFSAIAMVPVSEWRMPTLTVFCAIAPFGQMKGAGTALAAAPTALAFRKSRLLILLM